MSKDVSLKLRTGRRTKRARFEVSLPPPMVYDKLNRISWMSFLRKKYVAPRSTKPTLGVIYRVKKIGKGSNAQKLQSKGTLASFKLINYFRPKDVDEKIVKKSTVEITKRRSKRAVDYPIESVRAVKPVESPNRQSRSNTTNLQDTPDRLLSILQSLKYVPNLAIFYRHPELSVEDQHQQLNDNSREPSKGRTAREENLLSRLKATRTSYSPVFEECNDTTAASEVEDLNIPPPRPKYLKPRQPYIPDIDLPAKSHLDHSSRKPIDTQIFQRKLVTANIDEERRQIKTPKLLKTHWTSTKNITPRNSSYVNLRDHQEEAKKMSDSGDGRIKVSPTSSSSEVRNYPKDTQSYNPDNIPYVEVPDYTDQREESLDEDDRRVAKERYRNVNDDGEEEELGATLALGSDDVVDPDAPEVSEALPDPGKNTPRTSSTVSGKKSTGRSGSVQEHHDDVDREKRPESGVLLLPSEVSRGPEFASEIGKDHCQGEEIKDGETEKPADSGLPADAAQVSKNTDDDIDRSLDDKSQNEKDDDSRSIVDFQPVHFDINEYIKPFDFAKLFAGEKKISNDDSSDYPENDSREETGSERSNSDAAKFADSFSSRYGKPSGKKTFFRFDLDREDSDEDPKEFTIIKSEKFSFGNKDFFKPISDEEREKSDRFVGTSDFLSRFASS